MENSNSKQTWWSESVCTQLKTIWTSLNFKCFFNFFFRRPTPQEFQTARSMMCKFKEHGLTLHYEKCITGGDGMEYMGEVLTGEGLQVSKKRVEGIVHAPDPKIKDLPNSVPNSSLDFRQYQAPCGTWPVLSSPGSGVARKKKLLNKLRSCWQKPQSWPTLPSNRRITCWSWSSLRTTTSVSFIRASVLCQPQAKQCGETILPVWKGGTSHLLGLSKILPLLVWNQIWTLHKPQAVGNCPGHQEPRMHALKDACYTYSNFVT